MKPSEMKRGKRYRVVLEGEASLISTNEATIGTLGQSNILMDRSKHIISIEELPPEPPTLGTVVKAKFVGDDITNNYYVDTTPASKRGSSYDETVHWFRVDRSKYGKSTLALWHVSSETYLTWGDFKLNWEILEVFEPVKT